MSGDTAELDALERQAQALEAERVTTASMAATAPDTPPALDMNRAGTLAQEITGIVLGVVNVLGPALPSVKALYTPEVTQAAAESVAVVCVKHGWLSGGIGGKYAEELAAAFVLGPLAIATANALKADLPRLKTKPAKPAPAVPAAGEGDGGQARPTASDLFPEPPAP
jgi:hypothetical protein